MIGLASTALAQLGGFGNGYGGFAGHGPPGSDGNNSPFPSDVSSFIAKGMKILTAHAVLASVAFVFFFPFGGILIRLGSFRGLWIVHGILQLFAYCLYIAAVGLGLYMAMNLRLLNEAHPIIGLALFALLFFQPILGFLHHYAFKKYSRRTVWSHGHLWLGRIIITLGIIDGGLGLQLAKRTRIGSPSNSQIIAYGTVAGLMWLAYMAAAVVGEWRRRRTTSTGEWQSYSDETKINESPMWH
jgi:hypothetical protein